MLRDMHPRVVHIRPLHFLVCVMAPAGLFGIHCVAPTWSVEYDGNVTVAVTLGIMALVMLFRITKRLSMRYNKLDDGRGKVLFATLVATGIMSLIGYWNHRTTAAGTRIDYYLGNSGNSGNNLWLVTSLIAFWHIYKVYMVMTRDDASSKSSAVDEDRSVAPLA